MRKYLPAIAILALMAIVCLVAIVAPHMTSTVDWIALWLSTACLTSVPVLVLWSVGMDIVNPVRHDYDDDDGPYSSV